MIRYLILSCAALAVVVPDATGQRRSKPVVRMSPDQFPPLPKSHTMPAPKRPQPDGARPIIMVTGYWPPTNEMCRRFSTSATQNPQGWIGSNWENRGYDIHSFFPEFPNGIGKGVGDFEVDYQDTVADWARITQAMKPIAIITNSRGGGSKNWEIEMNGQNHPSWVADYLAPFYPNPSPPDASIPARTSRRSTLPVREILAALNASTIDVNPWACFYANGGTYLSEFKSYHGLWYKNTHNSRAQPDWCVASGHIHVGPHTVSVLEQALFVSLRETIKYVDKVVAKTAQHNYGYGNRGTGVLSMAGTGLGFGQKSDLLLDGVPANSPLLMLMSTQQTVTPTNGGILIASPLQVILPTQADAQGRLLWKDIAGGGGPATFYLHFAYPDNRVVGGVGLSNALEVQFEK